MPTKAEYTYGVFNDVLWIVDSNNGKMSVTNDIENVVEEIYSKNDMMMRQRPIVYCDSMGNWDGWDQEDQEFFSLQGAKTKEQAINRILKLQSGFKS